MRRTLIAPAGAMEVWGSAQEQLVSSSFALLGVAPLLAFCPCQVQDLRCLGGGGSHSLLGSGLRLSLEQADRSGGLHSAEEKQGVLGRDNGSGCRS